MREASQKSLDDPWREVKMVLAGGIAGVVSRSATAPIDRAKMLMMVESSKKMTMASAFTRMRSEGGGWRQYFKGNGANCLKVGPEMACKLAVNDELKRHYRRWVVDHQEDRDELYAWERLMIGGVSGVLGQLLIYPMEVVKVRLAVSPNGTYTGVWDVLRKVWGPPNGGFRPLYRGLVPSLVGIFPYAGVDIMLFEIFKGRLVEHFDDEVPGLALFMAGAGASTGAQFISYPFALIRTRMQAQGGLLGAEKYKGMWDAFAVTIRDEGMKGLFKGLTPNMLKLAPAAAVSWWTFERVKKSLGIDIRT